MPRSPKAPHDRRRSGSRIPVAPLVWQSERWDFAEALLVDLVPTAEVVRRLAERFEVSESTAYQDVRAARDRWTVEASKERPAKRQEMHARLRRVERAALAKGDLSTVVKVLSLASDLDGLRQKGDEAPTGALTPEESEALREALGKRPA